MKISDLAAHGTRNIYGRYGERRLGDGITAF
jgi:hypothetical protein